jgi:iron-sulfur cluster assembly protein
MENQVVTVTDKAKEKILEIFRQEQESKSKGLRLAVVGGGCSGFSYKIEVDEIAERDYRLELGENVQVVIDPKSSIYLKGCTLDFQDGLQGKGFVFENPSAKNTCGCGESFSI